LEQTAPLVNESFVHISKPISLAPTPAIEKFDVIPAAEAVRGKKALLAKPAIANVRANQGNFFCMLVFL